MSGAPSCSQKPFSTGEGHVRAGHAQVSKLDGEEPRPGGGRGGAALPHGELAGASDAQGEVRHGGERYGLTHLIAVQAHDVAGGAGGADGDEDAVVPAVAPEDDLVREAAECLVGEGHGGDEGPPIGG